MSRFIEHDPKIWLYWDPPAGGDPSYIEHARHSIERWATPYEVVVLNRETAHRYVEGLHTSFADLEVIAHRADYVRAACLAQNGGFWCDIDTVALMPFSLLWDLVGINGALFYGWRPKEPSIGMIAAMPKHPLLVAWREAIERRLDDPESIRWSGVGYDLLWPLAKEASYTQLSNLACAPTHWKESAGLFSDDIAPEAILSSETVMVQLYNKGLSDAMGRMTSAELLESETLLARLLKRSELKSGNEELAALRTRHYMALGIQQMSQTPEARSYVDGTGLLRLSIQLYRETLKTLTAVPRAVEER